MSGAGPGSTLAQVTRLLEAAGAPYFVSGSFASTLHGAPRATQDLDLVIDPTPEQLELLLAGLPAGAYYVDRGAAREALRRRDMFNVIDLANGWKVDLIVRKDRAFSREELARRRRAEIDGVDVFVVSPEDSVLSKLEWASLSGSERQLEDVRGILAVQGARLDVAYVDRWAHALGVVDLWARVRPPDG